MSETTYMVDHELNLGTFKIQVDGLEAQMTVPGIRPVIEVTEEEYTKGRAEIEAEELAAMAEDSTKAHEQRRARLIRNGWSEEDVDAEIGPTQRKDNR